MKTICRRQRVWPLLIIVICLTAASCRKQSLDPQKQESANLLNINDFQPSEQRVIYPLLSGIEKYNAWRAHFEEFRENEILTPDQLLYIDEISNFISVRLFSEPLTYETDKKLVYFKDRGLTLFGKEKAIYLLATLSPHESGLPNFADVEDNCNCSRSSDFCNGLMVCRDKVCKTKDGGCGLLWVYTCDGLCGSGPSSIY